MAELTGAQNKLNAERADLQAAAAKMSSINEALALDKVQLNKYVWQVSRVARDVPDVCLQLLLLLSLLILAQSAQLTVAVFLLCLRQSFIVILPVLYFLYVSVILAGTREGSFVC